MKTNLELDHIFCFCPPDLPEVKIFERHGFRANAGRLHANQGTGNRSIIFEDNYLELIYLHSEVEAKSNPLQLQKRAQWRETGASPFGIALRGTISEADRKSFWEYRPSWNPSAAVLVCKTDDKIPLLFIASPRGDTPQSLYPKNRSDIDKSLLIHATNSKRIVAAHFQGPKYRWPLSSHLSNLTMSEAAHPHAEILIDGNIEKSFQPNVLLTISKS